MTADLIDRIQVTIFLVTPPCAMMIVPMAV
jgi:hypothetical protein